MSVESAPPVVPSGEASRSTAEPVVTAQHVTKQFGDTTALEDVSLTIRAGELYGIVGPSGCGKTTLIRALIGLASPSDGEIRVAGREPGSFRPRDRKTIGYLPQEFSLYPTLTAMQNARLIASLYGVGWFRRRRRIRDLLTFLELWDARKRLAQDLSGGMRRRLSLATALIHEPSLLVVDEPTAGLDPALRARIWEYLQEVRRRGTTIILTTQYLEEAERCDHVAVLGGGRMIASGTPDELRSRAAVPDTLTMDVDAYDGGDLAALWQLSGVREVRPLEGNQVLVRGINGEELSPLITDTLTERGRDVRSIEVDHATFEDVFMQISSRR